MRRILIVTSLAVLALTPVTAVSAAGARPAAGHAAAATAGCQARWTFVTKPIPQLHGPGTGAIASLSVLSPSDAWAFVFAGKSGRPAVFHDTGTAWQGPIVPPEPPGSGLKVMAAGSDSNVWVFGSLHTSPYAERYSAATRTWTNESPRFPILPTFTSAVAAKNGVVYVAGRNDNTERALLWKFDGSRWTDITPTPNPLEYDGLALTRNGTLLVVGGGQGPVLQERSANGTWTTIAVTPGPVELDAVTAAPDGTVFAVGFASTGPVLVRQLPGAKTATVLRAPLAPVNPQSTFEKGVVAVSRTDVWLLGEYSAAKGNSLLPWPVLFDGTGFLPASTPAYGSGSGMGAGAMNGGTLVGNEVLAFGSDGTPGAGVSFPRLIGICPVLVGNRSLDPATTTMGIGGTTFWSVPAADSGSHRLVSPSVFDSGTLRPGAAFGYKPFAAATYLVRDSRSGATSRLGVAPAVIPGTGTTSTVFHIVVAHTAAPVGYRYHLLIERPGSNTFVPLSTTGQARVAFLASRPGTYRFEVKLSTPSGTTAPSPPAGLKVS